MMRKICCFAGHSEIYGNRDIVTEKLIHHTERLITEEGVTEFWVGYYGIFDTLSASAVDRLKEKYPQIKLNLIIPYVTERLKDRKNIYDEIIMADIPHNTPMQYRIIKCNQYMIKKSAFLVCYIKNSWGGAAKTFDYAKSQKHINIINIGDEIQ